MAVETVAEHDLSLEEALARLEGLTEDLERGVELEEEVRKFVRGRELLARCEKVMREVEARFTGAADAHPLQTMPARSDEDVHPGEHAVEREEDRRARARKEPGAPEVLESWA